MLYLWLVGGVLNYCVLEVCHNVTLKPCGP